MLCNIDEDEVQEVITPGVYMYYGKLLPEDSSLLYSYNQNISFF